MDESQLLAWSQYIKLTVGLFAISTPLAAVPIYLSLTRDLDVPARRRVATISASAYVLTLGLFTAFGDEILAFFGITLEAFKVAGGLLLLLSALRMMRPSAAVPAAEEATGSSAAGLAVVPLTIPILAGPGAITTVVIYTHDQAAGDHQLWMIAAIVLVAAIIFVLFRLALRMGALLGPSAVQILNQVMGLIVAAIGAEFLLEGIREAL
jgi:multiple antibiotic resistance protein